MIKYLIDNLKLLFVMEKRFIARKNVSYSVACKPALLSYKDHNGLLGSDEIITRTVDINQSGMCVNWPTNFKCHLCKNRVDIGLRSICEADVCNFVMSGFKVGEDMLVTLQVKDRVIEDIKAKIVWYKEAERSSDLYGKIGLKFYEELEVV